VFITGATSGIGYGLALHYAKMGGIMPVTGQIRSRDASVNGRHPIHLSITGRNATLLAKVKEDCEEIGAKGELTLLPLYQVVLVQV
jgi:NAD(P)-dependent dehydrogenase (short-subunit alcohol dehydrogenase family)